MADFTALAGRLVEEIAARGHLPILVGGTGLYVQSFLYGVRFTEEKAPDGLREQLAAELTARGPAALYSELQAVDPEAAAAIHPNNHVRVLRALEHYRATGRRLSEQKAASLPPERPYRALVLGLDFAGRDQLYRRIDARVDRMLEQGLLEEARMVYGQPPDLPHRGPGHRLQGILPLFCGGGQFGTLRQPAETGVPAVCQAAADLVPPYGRGGLAGGRQPRPCRAGRAPGRNISARGVIPDAKGYARP